MKKIIEKPENIFFIICLFWGVLFLLINPPFQAPDEDSHLYKIYGITQGSWNFKKITLNKINEIDLGKKYTFAGQILPTGLIEATMFNKDITFNPKEKTDIKKTLEIAKIKLKKDNAVFVGYPVPVYTPLSYMPAVVLIWLLSLFNAPPLFMLFAARFSGLFLYLALCYFAIKTTPVKKWLFFVTALLPMCVYEAGACSTDAMVNGLSFLLVAYALNLKCNENISEITTKNSLIFFLLIQLLSICKFTYFPLVGLYLLIPKEKFNNNKTKSFCLIFFTSLIITSLLVIYLNFIAQGCLSHSTNLDPKILLENALLHPIKYLILVIKTVIFNLNLFLNGIIGFFGWSDTLLPGYVIYALSGLLLVCSLVNNSDENCVFSLKDKTTFLAMSLISAFLIISVFYLIFLPKNGLINGVQGRYLIPVLIPFLLIFHNNKIKLKTNALKFLSVIIVNAALLISLITIIYRFYI